MKVTAVVVTYNRLELLEKTLDSIFSQSRKPDTVLVVDNASSDGTKNFLEELSKRRKDLIVVRLDENVGGSGGFNEGLKRAFCNTDSDWFWLMDDDAIPEKDALEKLLKAYEILKKRGKNVGVLVNEMVPDVRGPKPMSFKRRFFGMFVGFLVRRSVVERVGFPRRDFFIYYDDAEYSLRIKRAGFSIYEVEGSFIYHRDWAREKRVKRFFVSKPDISPWKAYYVYRNGFLMFKNPVVRFALLVYFSVDLLSWYMVKKEVVPFAVRGLKDGLKGVSGKVVGPGDSP